MKEKEKNAQKPVAFFAIINTMLFVLVAIDLLLRTPRIIAAWKNRVITDLFSSFPV